MLYFYCMSLIYTIGIILFALAGVFVSGYIAKVKNTYGKESHRYFEKNCNLVTYSHFSHFLGIQNEIIRLFIYVIIALFYIASLIFPIPSSVVFYALIVASVMFIFDLRLLFIQLIVLKRWCTLCLWSSSFSFMILVMSFLGFQASFGNYLFELHDILKWIFFFGIVVGIISSSLHAKSFIRFLRDFQISKDESKRLTMFSHIGWTAITILSLSGLSLILTDKYHDIIGSSDFIVILFVMGIIIIYEIVVNLYIAPKLIDIHFGDHQGVEEHHHMMLRKTSFTFVAIGVMSWYVLLVLSVFSFYQYTALALLLAYSVLLIIVVLVALYMEHLFYKMSELVYETIEEVDAEE